jgi:membrane associated rhomboid family serine protease
VRAASFGKAVRVAAAPRAVTIQPKPAPRSVAAPDARFVSRALARIPFFTLAVSGALAFKFNTELRAATDYTAPASPGHFSLLALGASDRAQVLGHGEWWRLFTSTALHGSPSHLTGNLVALLVTGLLLEPMVGAGWFAAIYMLGALAGALVSMLLNPPGLLGVGASGAIMATLAALFVLSFHAGARRPNAMRRVAAALLFPALIPAVSHGATVDINAHFGGVVAGTALAFVLLVTWPEERPTPPGRTLAAVVAALLVACTVWAFLQTGGKYENYARPGLDFIPPAEMPRSREAMAADSYALVEKYPADPRAHMFRGLYFLSRRDLSDAEPHLRDAIRLHQDVMTARFQALTRALLALDLTGMGRRDEAAPLAAMVCGDATLPPEILDSLRRTALCH